MPMPKKKNRPSLVYKATNCVNGHFYIGVTNRTLSIRQRRHIQDAINGDSQLPFHRAIRKNGVEAFHWEILNIYPTYEKALDAEVRYIKRLKPKYNVLPGGTIGPGPSMRRKVICLETGEVFDSVTSAAYQTGANPGCISQVCTGYAWTSVGQHFAFYTKKLSEKQRKKTLLRVLKKKAKSRSWDVRYPKRKRCKYPKGGKKDALGRSKAGPMANARKVICLDTQQVFESCSAAARAFSTNSGFISSVCSAAEGRGTRRSAKGFKFAFYKMPRRKRK